MEAPFCCRRGRKRGVVSHPLTSNRFVLHESGLVSDKSLFVAKWPTSAKSPFTKFCCVDLGLAWASRPAYVRGCAGAVVCRHRAAASLRVDCGRIVWLCAGVGEVGETALPRALLARGRLRLVFSLPAVGRSASSERSRSESKIFAAVRRRSGKRSGVGQACGGMQGGRRNAPLPGPNGRPAHECRYTTAATAARRNTWAPAWPAAVFDALAPVAGWGKRFGTVRSLGACKPGKSAQSASCGVSVSTAGEEKLTSPVWGRRAGPGGDAPRPARRLRTARRLAADRPRNPRHARVEEL